MFSLVPEDCHLPNYVLHAVLIFPWWNRSVELQGRHLLNIYFHILQYEKSFHILAVCFSWNVAHVAEDAWNWVHVIHVVEKRIGFCYMGKRLIVYCWDSILFFLPTFCLWLQEDYRNFMPGCPWEEDLKYAKAVCDEVGAIPSISFSCWWSVTYLGSNMSPNKVICINWVMISIEVLVWLFYMDSVTFITQVGVELRVMHFTDEYWDFVVSLSKTLLCNMRFDLESIRF